MSPGDFIKHLTVKKTSWKSHSLEEQKSYNPFIMILWISMMAPDLMQELDFIQSKQVPDRDHYNFLLAILPKKSLYNQWIKPRKKEYTKDVIERLAAFYNEGSSQIIACIDILDKSKIENILKQQGLGEKEIKKLIA